MDQNQNEPTFNPADPFNQKNSDNQPGADQYGIPQQPLDNTNMGGMYLQSVPNSTGVLVLGILSIVGCFCYGIVGIILGVIALVLAGPAKKLYETNPGGYQQSSYNNLKAGRICAIIGVSLSAIYLLLIALYFSWFFNAFNNGLFTTPFE